VPLCRNCDGDYISEHGSKQTDDDGQNEEADDENQDDAQNDGDDVYHDGVTYDAYLTIMQTTSMAETIIGQLEVSLWHTHLAVSFILLYDRRILALK
jgi:hypothetical protein